MEPMTVEDDSNPSVPSFLYPSDYVEKVGFCYTSYCNIHCAHCCSDCGPWRTEKFDPALVVELLDEIKGLGTEISGFTGGEALAYQDEILWILSEARPLGLKYSVATNCSFAEDIERARDLIGKLKALGLASMFVSYDVYHAPFIHPACIVNAVTACKELGLSVRLYAHQRVEDKGIESLLPEEVLAGLDIVSGRIIPAGRAADLQLAEADWNPHFYEGFCDPKSSLMIYPDGSVMPCCAIANSSANLALGNVRKEKLADIVARYRRSPYFRFIKTKGFSRLYKAACMVAPGTRDERFVETCGFCKYIVENDAIMAAIQSILAENDIAVCNELLDGIAEFAEAGALSE